MVFAIALPKINLSPKRMAVESTLSDIRQAFADTAARARAGGKGFALILDPEAGKMVVIPREENELSREWRPTPPGGNSEQNSVFLLEKDSYEISKEVEWTWDERDCDPEGRLVFSFFPNGEAAGPALNFTLKNRKFLLYADNITGVPCILEQQ